MSDDEDMYRSQEETERSPSRQEIERRAYEIYVARGCEDGRDLEDWVMAERELKSRASSETRPSTEAPTARQRSAAAGRSLK